jgi:thioredoxin:protein disulfide reductase
VPLTERLAVSLQGSLGSGDLTLALGAAWLGGLLTALTPCVYPLIPITIRYFGASRATSKRRAVVLAGVYVLGMTLLYAVLGTAFASLNVVFGSFLSSPYVSAAIGMFCFAMGASMLGAFTVALPASLNTRLSRLGGQSAGGAFVMGLVSGVIAAPCTGPVLAVILALVARSGGAPLGFLLMSAFGLGLGLPFMLIAVFSGALQQLPQSGVWMEVVKACLAAAMFVVGLYFLRFALPPLRDWLDTVPEAGFAGLVLLLGGAFAAGVYLHLFGSTDVAAWFKGGSVALLTLGASFAVLSDNTPETIEWQTSHERGLAVARELRRPVMIDFTADWCQACKELDRETYVDPRVRAEAERFVTLKIDATTIDDPMQALFERYAIMGLPTVIFIDSAGTVLDDPRVTGFVEAERFTQLMEKVR